MDLHAIAKRYTDRALLIRQRRSGDVVAVKRLMLLAAPNRKAGGTRADLYAAIDALEAAGATVLELETGRSTSDRKQRDGLIRDAVDDLAQTRKGTGRTGRKSTTHSPEQIAIIRLHWYDLRHPTNEYAIEAMARDGVKVTTRQISKYCKGSGRPIGGPKRTKRKR